MAPLLGGLAVDIAAPWCCTVLQSRCICSKDKCAWQVLLAIAAGAVLVTPEWLTSSLEAGEWLPEAPFLAQVSPCMHLPPRFCTPAQFQLLAHLFLCADNLMLFNVLYAD